MSLIAIIGTLASVPHCRLEGAQAALLGLVPGTKTRP
jgi:hypothetical protein